MGLGKNINNFLIIWGKESAGNKIYEKEKNKK